MCDVKRCRNTDTSVIYMDKELCDRCWGKYGGSPGLLRANLGIDRRKDRHPCTGTFNECPECQLRYCPHCRGEDCPDCTGVGQLVESVEL